MRDNNLARAALALVDAAERANDLLDAGMTQGFGDEDFREEWPSQRQVEIIVAVVRAADAVRTALREGNYWLHPDDDENEELRPDSERE